MNLFHLFFPCLFIAGTAQAQATFSIGPTVGGNLATMHVASNNAPHIGYHNDAADFGYHLDWIAGAQAAVEWGKFAVQPALLFSQKGYTNDYEIDYLDANHFPAGRATIRNNVRLGYLTLPVNFCFAPLGAKTGPQLFAGPYVSVLLSARDVHTSAYSLPNDVTVTGRFLVADKLDLLPDQYGVRRFDAGLQGGVGYRYEAFLLQASYSLGLRDTMPTYLYGGSPVPMASNYNRVFQASLAYLFSTTK